MNRIPESELILNEDGSIYHLHLYPDQIGDLIFTVGDPDRVAEVSKYFDSLDFQNSKREFVTHSGRIGGRKVSAMSTGMGTDNVEIFMNELDALVNIDLENRTIKKELTQLQIVRLGTSGAIQPNIPVGSLLLSEKAIGIDTMMNFYPDSSKNQDLARAFKEFLKLDFTPYQTEASLALSAKANQGFIQGITLTAPGFYAPQGREIRYSTKISDYAQKIQEFEYGGQSITNLEMETAGYYALGELLGHEVLSLNAILANRALGTFDSNPSRTVEKLIEKALSIFV